MDQQRPCAVKLCIQEILEGELVAEPEQGVFLRAEQGITIHRVNVVGTILHQETVGTITNVLLDDGTGKIVVRFFEHIPILNSLEVGSPLLVIGKVREYNQERYISPEIAKLVSLLWLKTRYLEIYSRKEKMILHQGKERTTVPSANKEQETPIETIEVENIFSEKERNKQQEGEQKRNILMEKNVEKRIDSGVLNFSKPKAGNGEGLEEEEQKEDEADPEKEGRHTEVEGVVPGGLPFDRILGVIQELDHGDGAMIEEVIEKSPIKETETLLQKMLEKGDIFQIVPGKVKVL